MRKLSSPLGTQPYPTLPHPTSTLQFPFHGPKLQVLTFLRLLQANSHSTWNPTLPHLTAPFSWPQPSLRLPHGQFLQTFLRFAPTICHHHHCPLIIIIRVIIIIKSSLGPGQPSASWAKVDRREGTVLMGKLLTPATLSSVGSQLVNDDHLEQQFHQVFNV